MITFQEIGWIERVIDALGKACAVAEVMDLIIREKKSTS